MAFGMAFLRRFGVFGGILFAPSGESLLSNATKGTKKSRPSIRFFAQAKNSLIESKFQRHATTGRPWPIVALAASMPLNP